MKEATTPLRTRLDENEMAELKAIAARDDRSVCSLVRVAVRQYIAANKVQ